MKISNSIIASHAFLQPMYADAYFPNFSADALTSGQAEGLKYLSQLYGRNGLTLPQE